jgi:histidyl-tRNA synthetase
MYNLPMKISTQPYKGARDFYPEELKIRSYIFETWRKVCKRYGYEEYDGPFIESLELYEAKSGEELVNEQLYSFIDKGERKVAIRPEMTPTLSRMVANKHKELVKPIRWFSIPNLWRYEKPQKGRLREHYQLNVDTFGNTGVEADFEIISLLINIMREFGAKETMFEVRINNRRLMEDIYKKLEIPEDKYKKVGKAIDKKPKISHEDFVSLLKETTALPDSTIDTLCQFFSNPQKLLSELENMSEGAREVKRLLELLSYIGLDKYARYEPTIMRGLDYYTGNVFEIFDLNPTNSRAISGGGRYDDLVELFIDEKIPGVGFGMGDVTMKDFLETWKLIPELPTTCEYLVTVWPSEKKVYLKASLEIANALRNKKKETLLWLETNSKLDKQLKYADKKGVSKVIIIGEQEIADGTVTIKNLKDRSQTVKTLEKFLAELE